MSFQRASFSVEIVACTSHCCRCYSNIRVMPIQNRGMFCCYCSGRVDGFGENGGDYCYTFISVMHTYFIAIKNIDTNDKTNSLESTDLQGLSEEHMVFFFYLFSKEIHL